VFVADLTAEFLAQCVEGTLAVHAVLSQPLGKAFKNPLAAIMGIGTSRPSLNPRLNDERARSVLVEILE